MPDVKMWRSSALSILDKNNFLDKLQLVVAQQMSCNVPKKNAEGYEYYELDPANEIDVPVFDFIQGRSGKLAIIEVAAYPYEDRMRTIKQRRRWIAASVAEMLGVLPDEVSVTFIEVPFDYWGTGEEDAA